MLEKIQLTLAPMENEFSPTLLEVSRENISAMIAAFRDATQIPATVICRIIVGDTAFSSRYLKTGLTVSTYDDFMGRMSLIWPAHAAWPASVPRPEPILLKDGMQALLDEHLRKSAPPTPEEALGEPWPADIPKPKTGAGS